MPHLKILQFLGGILLVIPYSLPSKLCFDVEDTCANDNKYNSSIQYGGEQYFGGKRLITPQSILTYNNITEFIGRNICDNYTLITGLAEHQYNKEQKQRDDTYTFYGNSGSIIASEREQKVRISRRLVIHEPVDVVSLRTNLNTNLFPDLLTMHLWWDHFYSLLGTSSVVEVKKIKSIIKSREGHSYKLDCKTGKILVIADLSCVYLHGLSTSSDTHEPLLVSFRHQAKLSSISSKTCARKLPIIFSGSVIVKVPQANIKAKRSCTNSHYICATGKATVRAIHIIKTHLNVPSRKKQVNVSEVENIFDCSCKENDHMIKVGSSSNCIYKRIHSTPDRLQILNHETLSMKYLCLKNDKCHYNSSMVDSRRACSCVGQDKQVAIEHYYNEYGMLKNPTGADGLNPCKRWLPYGAKESFELIPPFKRIKHCEESDNHNADGEYSIGNKSIYGEITSYRAKRWAWYSDRRRSYYSRRKNCNRAATTKSVQKLAEKLSKIFKEEYKALERNNIHDNLIVNRVNLNSYHIVDLGNRLEDVILEINRDLSIIEKEIAKIQMKIELDRIQTVINEINTHRIRTFLMRMHKKRLNLMNGAFKINEVTGCAQLPNHHAVVRLGYLNTFTPYSMLKPINRTEFRFNIEPPPHINSIHQHNYFKIILIGVVLLVFVIISICACKIMC